MIYYLNFKKNFEYNQLITKIIIRRVYSYIILIETQNLYLNKYYPIYRVINLPEFQNYSPSAIYLYILKNNIKILENKEQIEYILNSKLCPVLTNKIASYLCIFDNLPVYTDIKSPKEEN